MTDYFLAELLVSGRQGVYRLDKSLCLDLSLRCPESQSVMPTQLDRIQVLCQPELFADIKTLSKYYRKSLSMMCSTLIEAAIKNLYATQLENAEVVIAAKEHPGTLTRQANYVPDDLDDAIELLSGILEKVKRKRYQQLRDRVLFEDDFLPE